MVKLGRIISLVLIICSLMFIADAGIARFRFYAHDLLSGPNATGYEVARANFTATSPTLFGQVNVADTIMTVTPNINSQKLGNVNILAASVSMTELNYLLTGAFTYTYGRYNGSSLSILGLKLILSPNQRLPVVGGTGVFNKAQGYLLSNLQSFDPATNTYVWRYDTYVYY